MADDDAPSLPHEALADAVFDHLAGHFNNDATNGFDVYASSETGAAAVGYRPGIVGAQASIRRQVMVPWANSLKDAGFNVVIDYSGEGQDRAPSWIHVAGRTADSEVVPDFDVLPTASTAGC